MNKKDVLIVGGRGEVRDGIKALVEAIPEVRKVVCCDDITGRSDQISNLNPDLVILDSSQLKENKMNKIQITLVGLVILLVLGLSTATVSGGELVTETRVISEIRTVRLKGQGQIIVNQGEEESLTIEARENVISSINTTVSDATLTLEFKRRWFQFWLPRKGIKYYLTLSDPREFIISGSGSLDATDISVKSFRVQINGSGKGYITNLVADQLVTDVNGSGKFVVGGNVRKQRIEISGSANYRASNLTSDIALVKISGSGKTELNVRNELDVRISGSGTVLYQGNPRITQRISGSGKIRNID